MEYEKFEWVLVTTQYGEFVDITKHNTRADMIEDLSNVVMFCTVNLDAMYHRGRLLSESEIEPLRKEAFENLGPIGKLKALGKV